MPGTTDSLYMSHREFTKWWHRAVIGYVVLAFAVIAGLVASFHSYNSLTGERVDRQIAINNAFVSNCRILQSNDDILKKVLRDAISRQQASGGQSANQSVLGLQAAIDRLDAQVGICFSKIPDIQR
jgi:hypothetical protein